MDYREIQLDLYLNQGIESNVINDKPEAPFDEDKKINPGSLPDFDFWLLMTNEEKLKYQENTSGK